jgi:hypothetical protein
MIQHSLVLVLLLSFIAGSTRAMEEWKSLEKKAGPSLPDQARYEGICNACKQEFKALHKASVTQSFNNHPCKLSALINCDIQKPSQYYQFQLTCYYENCDFKETYPAQPWEYLDNIKRHLRNHLMAKHPDTPLDKTYLKEYWKTSIKYALASQSIPQNSNVSTPKNKRKTPGTFSRFSTPSPKKPQLFSSYSVTKSDNTTSIQTHKQPWFLAPELPLPNPPSGERLSQPRVNFPLQNYTPRRTLHLYSLPEKKLSKGPL